MDSEINLRYQLTENELLDAIRTQSMRTWSFRFLVAFILVVYIYIIVEQIIFRAPIESFGVTLAPVILVTVVFVFFTFSNPIMRRRIRKQPKYTCEQEWRFSEESIFWKTPYSEVKREWTYPKTSENAKYFVLFLKTNAFTPIPKRAFANANEESRFRELLKRKIPTWG
ncbi:MAG: YcxB family protein [Chloroflexi bacterium]|nr:YcxB family protein [Chloroflexota bacterium]